MSQLLLVAAKPVATCCWSSCQEGAKPQSQHKVTAASMQISLGQRMSGAEAYRPRPARMLKAHGGGRDAWAWAQVEGAQAVPRERKGARG